MSRYKMSLDKNILVKLKDAGFRQNNKWLVKGVSLVVEKKGRKFSNPIWW